MVAKVLSVAAIGFDGRIIEVESDASSGLPSLQIVGLGNKAIDEAKERVRSAIKNSLFDFPVKKITISLAPAELPKDGTQYDLTIALSILCVSGQFRQTELNDAIFAGILFLGEIPAYPRATLESLRQPLEDKVIAISRAGGRSTYPADFMLVATMNPCPCGYLGDTTKECRCSAAQILAY